MGCERTLANEAEIMSLIDAKNFNEVISFGKQIKKHLIITRGDKGAISVFNNEIIEVGVKKNLKILDLTGAGDLFASGFLFGFTNNHSIEKCGYFGNKAASEIIKYIGARPKISLKSIL